MGSFVRSRTAIEEAWSKEGGWIEDVDCAANVTEIKYRFEGRGGDLLGLAGHWCSLARVATSTRAPFGLNRRTYEVSDTLIMDRSA